jgi:hypothetical protein
MHSPLRFLFAPAVVACSLLTLSCTPQTGSVSSASPLTASQLQCRSTALAKRTDALAKAYDDYRNANVKALQERRDAELQAWKIADEREREKTFLGIAAAYTKEFNLANLSLSLAKQTTWNAYGNENKACP